MDTTLKLVTLQEAVRLTTLSRATFYRYVQYGHIPKPVKIGFRRVAWLESDIIEFCKAGVKASALR